MVNFKLILVAVHIATDDL